MISFLIKLRYSVLTIIFELNSLVKDKFNGKTSCCIIMSRTYDVSGLLTGKYLTDLAAISCHDFPCQVAYQCC